MSRGTTSRFTFDAQDSSSPVWSPDGSRIAYGSFRNGKGGLYQKLSNGTGPEEKLLESDVATLPVSWSPDGQSIVYSVLDPRLTTELTRYKRVMDSNLAKLNAVLKAAGLPVIVPSTDEPPAKRADNISF